MIMRQTSSQMKMGIKVTLKSDQIMFNFTEANTVIWGIKHCYKVRKA